MALMLMSCTCASLTDGRIIILEICKSRIFVKLHTFDAFLQVEMIKIVECHQMAISSKDIHLSIEDAHTLSISSTGFLSDDEAMSVIIDNLLTELLLSTFLVSNSF